MIALETAAGLKVRRARNRLIEEQPSYGTLALRLRLVEDAAVPFMVTDGSAIRYNPEVIEQLPELQVMAGFAHEASHCALLHPYRLAGRKLALYNVATDHAINLQLLADGFQLWPGALADARFAGMSSEQIYAILEHEDREQQSSPKPQPPNPGAQAGPGQPDFEPAPADAPAQDGAQQGQQPAPALSASDWQVAAQQAAAVARKAGTMPGGLERAMGAAYASQTDWITATRHWLEQFQPSDYSWSAPNKRYLAAGFYLPGLVRENMPALGIVVDTSGSVRQADLELFGGELTAILHELRPERLIVVYADTQVRAVEEFTPEDGEVKLRARGGGGTDFQPALDYFAELGEPVAGVIYLTDLQAAAPRQPADFEVLWGVMERHAQQPAPFGQLVRISAYAR